MARCRIKSRSGFTLAEILITLAVIGVIASLTIPGMIASNNKKQYVTGLKKAYSVFTQGFQKYAAEMSSPYNLRNTGLFEGDENYTKIAEDIPKIFNVAKVCGNTAGGGCFYSDDSTTEDYKYIGGSGGLDFDNLSYYKFVLADGMSVSVHDRDGNCNLFSIYSTESRLTDNTCAQVHIDVNGPKPPNVYGRDFFGFYVLNDGSLIPSGGIEHYKLNTNNAELYWKTATTRKCAPGDGTSDGSRCAARIIEEGWQMTY